MKVGDLVMYTELELKKIGIVVWGGKNAIKVQFVNEPHKQVWVSTEYLEVIGN